MNSKGNVPGKLPQIENKKEIVDFLRNLPWKADETATASEMPGLMISNQSLGLTFSQEEAGAYLACIAKLFKLKELSSRYTTDNLKSYFNAFLLELLARNADQPSDADLKNSLNDWLTKTLQASAHQFEVCGWIENIVAANAWEFGGARIIPAHDIHEELVGKLVASGSSNEEAALAIDGFKVSGTGHRAIMVKALSAHTSGKAKELFLDSAVEVVDVLRFLGIRSRGRRLESEVFPYFSDRGAKGSVRVISYSTTAAGMLSALRVPRPLSYPEILSSVEGAAQLAEKVLKIDPSSRSPIQSRIMRAVHWISEAAYSLPANARLLKVCIALECLLCGEKEEPYSRVLAERVAFLLGDSLEERLTLFRDTKKLYDQRSSIVHSGAIRDQEGDKALQFHSPILAVRVVEEVMSLCDQKGWEDLADVVSYIDAKKFGAG